MCVCVFACACVYVCVHDYVCEVFYLFQLVLRAYVAIWDITYIIDNCLT